MFTPGIAGAERKRFYIQYGDYLHRDAHAQRQVDPWFSHDSWVILPADQTVRFHAANGAEEIPHLDPVFLHVHTIIAKILRASWHGV